VVGSSELHPQHATTDLPRRVGKHDACHSEREGLSTTRAVRYMVSLEHPDQREYLPFSTPLVHDVGNESTTTSGVSISANQHGGGKMKTGCTYVLRRRTRWPDAGEWNV